MKFIKTVNRPYPPFYYSLIFEGHKHKESWLQFLGFPYASEHIRGIGSVWFYPEYHVYDFGKTLTEKLKEDPKLLDRLKNEAFNREERLRASVSISFKEFCEAYVWYMTTLCTFFVCDDALEELIRGLLKNATTEEEAHSLMELLVMPHRDNFHVLEALDLVSSDDVESHIQKWSWFTSRYGRKKKYSVEEAKEKKRVLEKEGYAVHLAKEKEDIAAAVLRAKELIDPSLAHMVDVMQFFIFYRTQRTDVMNMTMIQAIPMMQQKADELGVSYDDLLYLSYDEVTTGQYKEGVIEDRRKGCSIVGEPDVTQIVTGAEHEALVEEFLGYEDAESVKGKVAYKGVVKGRVVVIREQRDVQDFQAGDVLVAPMTTPNMVPYMKQAVAFVTDEGGIPCHASILARELKKPCVIGTGSATSVFKTGDFVEVDAEEGVVKKVK